MSLSDKSSRSITFCLSLALAGQFVWTDVSVAAAASDTPGPTLKLEGRAEVEELRRDKNLEAWQASQAYRWGAAALDQGNLPYACEWFRVAGDGFEASLGEGKYMGDARFSEGYARLLAKQDLQAAELFRIAVKIFQKHDPNSPYLRAALAALARMPKPKVAKVKPLQGQIIAEKPPEFGKFIALPGHIDKVAYQVPLKGKLDKFEDGTLLASLKDDQIFTGGKKRLLTQAAALDISDDYIKKSILKAFARMTCLETAALGGNVETATRNYSTLKSEGRSVAVGSADDLSTPVVTLVLNGNNYRVPMDLPGINAQSKNVLLITDGMHVVAIDPRTNDTWKLIATFNKQNADFNWWKLTHKKGSS